MAQQIFDQYAPLAKVSANETIPVVAAIAQTRDGKDELLHGTVPFVPAGGLYVPVSAANRLPVEATLSGRSVKHFATLLTNTPLAARGEAGSTYTSSVRDLTADGAHLGYGLTIYSDTFCVVRMSVWNPAGNYLQESNTLW